MKKRSSASSLLVNIFIGFFGLTIAAVCLEIAVRIVVAPAGKKVVWVPAETHWAENIGKTPVRILVSELK